MITFDDNKPLSEFSMIWEDLESKDVCFFKNVPVRVLVISSTNPKLPDTLHEIEDGNPIAVDLEWKPDHGKGKKNSMNPINVFQFCTSKFILIITNILENGTQSIKDFMSANKFYGKGIHCDNLKLKRMFDFNFDITDIETTFLKPLKLTLTFSDLITQLLGEPAAKFKDKSMTISDWSIHPLTVQQVLYAAFDVYALYKLLPILQSMPIPIRSPTSKQKHSHHRRNKSNKNIDMTTPNSNNPINPKNKLITVQDYTPKIPNEVTFADFDKDLKNFIKTYDDTTIDLQRTNFTPRFTLFSFLKSRSLVVSSTDGTINTCNQCGISFENQDQLIEHCWMEHNKYLPEIYFIEQYPPYWQNAVEQIDYAISNAVLSKGGKIISCTICHDSYTSFHCFYQHCRMVHIFPSGTTEYSLPHLLLRILRLLRIIQGPKCSLCNSDMCTGQHFDSTKNNFSILQNKNCSEPNNNPNSLCEEDEKDYTEKDIVVEQSDIDNEMIYCEHVWKNHGEILQSLFKHRPIHYFESTYKQSIPLGFQCMQQFYWGQMNWGNYGCSFCKITFEDPGELFIHLFHRHIHLRTINASGLAQWPLPAHILPPQLTKLIKGACLEFIINTLLQNEIYSKIDMNSIKAEEKIINDIKEWIKCNECNVTIKTKEDLWKHSLECHLAVTFEEYQKVKKAK